MTLETADTLKEEGLALFQYGAYDEAAVKFEAAITAYTYVQNLVGRAEMLNNLGVIYRLRGKREQAHTALTDAAAIFAQMGDHNRQAQALGNLGDLHAASRDAANRDAAARYYSDAAELFAQVGDRGRQSLVLRALSLTQLRRGRWVEAMLHMEASLSVPPHRNPFQFFFRGLLRFALRLLGAR